MSKGGRGATFNVLSVALLILTALTCLCYSTLFFMPALAGPFAAPTRVGLVHLPTSTPTLPAPPTLPATWTPTVTGTPTETPLPPTPSETPGPTRTPRSTNTRVPTRTQTVTPGPSPTVSPTRSKYRYTHTVTYQPAPAYGCGASIILGTITDLEGKPVTAKDMIVHIEGDADVDTGGALHPGEEFRGGKVRGISPFVGVFQDPSAWDVIINLSGTTAGVWRMWLYQGGQASEQIEIHLQGDCVYSSAVVRFQQNH